MVKLLDKYLIKIDRDKYLIPNSNIKIMFDGYISCFSYYDTDFGGIQELEYIRNKRNLIEYLINQGIPVNE